MVSSAREKSGITVLFFERMCIHTADDQKKDPCQKGEADQKF